MNTAILIRIGQWFISGIDDGAILLHPFEEIIHDVVGALRELKRKERLLCIAMVRPSPHNEPIHLNPGILGTRRADTSCSRKYLSCNQERHKGAEPSPRKGETPRNEIIFV